MSEKLSFYPSHPAGTWQSLDVSSSCMCFEVFESFLLSFCVTNTVADHLTSHPGVSMMVTPSLELGFVAQNIFTYKAFSKSLWRMSPVLCENVSFLLSSHKRALTASLRLANPIGEEWTHLHMDLYIDFSQVWDWVLGNFMIRIFLVLHFFSPLKQWCSLNLKKLLRKDLETHKRWFPFLETHLPG